MMPSESGAESPDQAAAQVGTAAASAVATAAPTGGGPDPEASTASLGRHLSGLGWPQVKRLDALLSEPIPIHGRGNFPTLSVQPRQIVQVSGTCMCVCGGGGGDYGVFSLSFLCWEAPRVCSILWTAGGK